MTTEPASYEEALQKAMHEATAIAAKYRALAQALTYIVGEARGLAPRRVQDPEDGEWMKPQAINSMVIADEIGLPALESSVVALHGQAGVWNTQVDEWQLQLAELGTEVGA